MSGHGPLIYQVSTSSEVPAAQRYEHWLTPLLSDFEAAVPSAQQQQDFRAQVTSLVTATSELHDMESDDFEGFRSKTKIRHHVNDKLALIFVMQGQVLSHCEGDTDIVTRPGQFVLFDARRPTHMRFHNKPRFVQINLPRAHLQAALSDPVPSQVSRAVSDSDLACLLSSQLARFRSLSVKLSAQERLSLLHATEALATTVVESACVTHNVRQSGLDGLCAAAQNHIRLNLESSHLNSTTIAAALGCSRATLYRAFEKQHLHIAEYIRELRLQKLARLLQQPVNRQPIAQLAQHCGLHDAPNLSRVFSKRFNMTPADFRRAHKNQNHITESRQNI